MEQWRAVQEGRKLAELEVKRAEEVLAQRAIHSPVNGVVVALLLHPGELASSNQKDPILRLMEIDPLHVELVLPVSQFGKIRRGQRARGARAADRRQLHGAGGSRRPDGGRGERNLRGAPDTSQSRQPHSGRRQVPGALLTV
jgi:multidrug resistance efflux pump